MGPKAGPPQARRRGPTAKASKAKRCKRDAVPRSDRPPVDNGYNAVAAHLDAPAVDLVRSAMTRFFWFCIGLIALALAFVGVALPLLPTTPFLLVAAFAFARSSSRMHAWLINHKAFGPLIENWRQHGAISNRAKTMAVVSLVAVFMLSLWLKAPGSVLAIQAVFLLGSGVFILSRPSGPR